ncbi:ABC transporter substrate-binding protein, partial [Klebsiella pneumoniae]|uniref:ABC transporter substrate-binding protein n=1 Tax=Klebsiella pneumoniae TaxID=573 RepID=UPI001EF7FC06
TYEFELRQGATWHDGRPFTADDVVFSLGLAQTFHPRGRTTFANVKGARAAGTHKVVVTLAKPAPYLLHALAGGETPIVARHIYDGKGDPLL